MSDVAVTVQEIKTSGSGLTPAYTGSLSTGNTYLVPNNGRVFMHVKKSGSNACTMTIATPNTVQGYAIADATETIAATTGDKMIGPFPTRIFGKQLSITYSEVTGLSHAAVRMP